jgi:putative membrane protein
VRGILLRWGILTVAIALTLWIMEGRGITVEGGFVVLLGIAAVYGLVNAIIKPIVTLLTCPFVILTLGLFMLLINTLMLSITGWLVPNMTIEGFWPAFWGSVIITIISAVLSMVISDD